MLAVLFQQCVLGPDYALSGSPTVTPSGIKVSKQRKLLGLLHPGLVVPGQKWRRSCTKHRNWRRWQKERWTDSRSKKDGKCLLYTFEISLVFRYRLLLRFRGTYMKDKNRSHYFPNALRISFPSGAADAGF